MSVLRRRGLLKESTAPTPTWDYEWTYDKGTLEDCGFTPQTLGQTNNQFTYNSTGKYLYVRTTGSGSSQGYVDLPSGAVGDNLDLVMEIDASVDGNAQSRSPAGIGFCYGITESTGYIELRPFSQSGSSFITRYTRGTWTNVNTPTFSKDTRYVFRATFIHDGNSTLFVDGNEIVSILTQNNSAGSANKIRFFSYNTYNRLRVYRISIKVL